MGQNLLLLLSDVIFFPFLRTLSARYLLSNVESRFCSEIRTGGATRPRHQKDFIRLKTIKGCWKMRICPDRSSRETSVLIFVLLVTFLFPTSLLAQDARSLDQHQSKQQISEPAAGDEIFRLERVPVAGGAELVTIHARLDGIQTPEHDNWVPLVTVLRDTLGDSSPENDRLRYVWPLTYTRPTIGQRLSGAVPFLYSRVGSRKSASGKAPPPVLDLAATDRDVWNKIFWTALQSLLLVVTLQIQFADQTTKSLVREFQSCLNFSKLRLRKG